ncbi:hypothetical protein BDV19DRAFT_232912 [Aspergillus venezuelensis]
MGTFNTPDWLRVILTILTTASFVPQLYKIWKRKAAAGISLSYLVINMICATEHFTDIFFLLVNNSTNPNAGPDAEHFIHSPKKAGDWINLAHVAVIWFCFCVLFISTIWNAPKEKLKHKVITVSLYASFLGISIVPLFIDATTNTFGYFHPTEYRRWPISLFFYGHFFYIHPIITVLGALSLLFQIWEMKASSKTVSGADMGISLIGLGVQAIIFGLNGILWFGRINLDSTLASNSFAWYRVLGWPIVDDFIFAAVQAVLFFIALLFRWKKAKAAPEDPSSESKAPSVSRSKSKSSKPADMKEREERNCRDDELLNYSHSRRRGQHDREPVPSWREYFPSRWSQSSTGNIPIGVRWTRRYFTRRARRGSGDWESLRSVERGR